MGKKHQKEPLLHKFLSFNLSVELQQKKKAKKYILLAYI